MRAPQPPGFLKKCPNTKRKFFTTENGAHSYLK
jgi:hypothetical protein